jgi:hypothetical protein
MKSRLLGALIAAVLCPFLSATTTVTGTVRTLGTTVAKGTLVRFWLRGCKGNQPRVAGVAIFPANVNGQFYFDIPTDSAGTVTGTLYSTRAANGIDAGEIDCGGSRVAVWYGMQVFRNSVGGPEVPVHAKDTATMDVSNVTPISTTSVVAAATGDTTYLRIDGGNSPLVGPLSGPLAVGGLFTVNGALGVSNSGVFTNDQIHQYATSFIGGIDPNMYHAIQGFPGYTTEAGSFGIAVPSNATANEADALVGMITSACNSASRTTCNSVAVSGHAQAIANGAGVWGQNTTVSNSIGTTATNLVGNEIDVGINGDQSGGYVHGLDIFLSPAPGSTMPSTTSGAALEIAATPPNAPPSKWAQGVYIVGTSIQSTGNAFYVDPACIAGPCASQKITLTGVNASNVPKFGTLQVDANGNFLFTSTGTGVGITYPSASLATLQASADPNFTVAGCTDCKNVADNAAVAGAACVSGGQGAMARKQNNRWDCN